MTQEHLALVIAAFAVFFLARRFFRSTRGERRAPRVVASPRLSMALRKLDPRSSSRRRRSTNDVKSQSHATRASRTFRANAPLRIGSIPSMERNSDDELDYRHPLWEVSSVRASRPEAWRIFRAVSTSSVVFKDGRAEAHPRSSRRTRVRFSLHRGGEAHRRAFARRHRTGSRFRADRRTISSPWVCRARSHESRATTAQRHDSVRIACRICRRPSAVSVREHARRRRRT